MKKLLLVIAIMFIASNLVHAECKIELDQTKNEGPYHERDSAWDVPTEVRGFPEDRYASILTAYWAYSERREPEAKNPRLYLIDQKTCQTLKTIELYPKDTTLTNGSSYGVSYNKPLGLVYITSRSYGLYQTETKYYNYTEIYSYNDLKLITRFEGETPLANAKFTDDGKEVIGFDYSKSQTDGTQIILWSAKDFSELKRSEPIGKNEFEKLGIQSNKGDIAIDYFQEQWFKNKGSNVEFKDQYVINLRGQDREGNYQSVAFTINGEPLLTVWRENGKPVAGYPSEYEKKFSLKINPLKFTEVQHQKEARDQTQETAKQPEALAAKPINPEPSPIIEQRPKPIGIQEQIAINRAVAKASKQKKMLYIALAGAGIVIITAVSIYLVRRLRKK